MATRKIVCTGDAFRGLVNPYTGQPMKVVMVVRPDAVPLYFAPDTYDTASEQPSARAAFENWNRVDGVGGLRRELRCAYTGELLKPAHGGQNHWFEGGFNPTRLHTRHEFLKFATMRDGTVDPRYADPPSAVKPVAEEPPMSKAHAVETTDAAAEAVESLVSKRKGNRK